MWGRHDDLSNISEILKYVWTQIAAMGGLCFAMCRRGSSLCPSSMFGCGLEWMVDGGWWMRWWMVRARGFGFWIFPFVEVEPLRK